MKALSLFTLVIAMTAFGNVRSEDQTSYQFAQGSVLIRCMAPEGQPQIATELFNRAFPQWITVLQERANEGLIGETAQQSRII